MLMRPATESATVFESPVIQVDGNYKQKPYHFWLDEVTLNAY
jgi:hypothetical protein